MNKGKKINNINYLILAKLVNFEQEFEFKEVDNINVFSAEKIVFLHRMFPKKINEVFHNITPLKFKKVMTQLLYYYYITKNYELFDDLVNIVKNKYPKLHNYTDRLAFLKMIVEFYFDLTEIKIIDLELSKSCEVERYIYMPSICLVAHFLEYQNLNISKPLWENRAKELLHLVANKKINQELGHILLSIWLQDINWPGSDDIFSYFQSLNAISFNKFIKNLTTTLEIFEIVDVIWLDTVLYCVAIRKDVHHIKLLEELREKSDNQENITKLLNSSINKIIPPVKSK